MCYNESMANKYPLLMRARVEIAAACGVAERKIAATFGISRGSVRRWIIAGESQKASTANMAWQKRNKQHVDSYCAKRRQDPKRKELARERTKIWYKLNAGKKTAAVNARRRGMKEWFCSEVEKLMIEYRYEDARRLTKETGIKHHVDHIIPLAKGGPHLPWNLQVLTETENLRKGAKI